MIYSDERKERLQLLQQNAKEELEGKQGAVTKPERLHGTFRSADSRAGRKASAFSLNLALVFLLLLLFIFVLLLGL